MKLIASDHAQAQILHAAFMNRGRFTLTGSGLRAEYVARTFNREPLAFGGYEESVELEQVSATESDTPTGWRGPEDGLPPLGVPIEMKHKAATSEWARPDFHVETLVWVGDKRFVTSEERVGDLSDYLFRPIRTPEQIAAEERAAAVSAMLADAGVTDSAWKDDPETVVWAEALYDAGYRKFEIVDEQP